VTTGDPKQAVILGLVAVGAVGFMIYRSLPKPLPPVAIPTSPRMAENEGEEKKFQTVVLSNAFWHPRLGEPAKVAVPKQPKPTSSSKPINLGQTGPANPFSKLPNVLGPDENTGTSQQQVEGPTIRVSAIIATDQRKEALISFGGAEEVKASAGMRFGDLIVVAVSETSVRIRIGKAEKTIAVGEEQKLWINENRKP
jgi:Fe2+ transport system protein FeoA